MSLSVPVFLYLQFPDPFLEQSLRLNERTDPLGLSGDNGCKGHDYRKYEEQQDAEQAVHRGFYAEHPHEAPHKRRHCGKDDHHDTEREPQQRILDRQHLLLQEAEDHGEIHKFR